MIKISRAEIRAALKNSATSLTVRQIATFYGIKDTHHTNPAYKTLTSEVSRMVKEKTSGVRKEGRSGNEGTYTYDENFHCVPMEMGKEIYEFLFLNDTPLGFTAEEIYNYFITEMSFEHKNLKLYIRRYLNQLKKERKIIFRESYRTIK